MHSTLEQLVAHRAAIGACFLDVRKPGWVRLIRKRISMMGIHNCALGQIFGSFHRGAHELGLGVYHTCQLGFSVRTFELGADTEAYARYYRALNSAWENEVQRRRSA